MNDIINEDVIEKVVIKSVAIYKAMSELSPPPFEDKFVNKENICQQNEIIQSQNLEKCLNETEPSKENEITDTTNETKNDYEKKSWKDITDPKERKKAYNKNYNKVYYKTYYKDNKEKLKLYKKVYNKTNKDKRKVSNKLYRETNKEKLKSYLRDYYKKNKVKLTVQKKAYYELNKKKLLTLQKVYYDLNKDNLNKQKKSYFKNRLKTDVQYKLACSLRSRLYNAVNKNYKAGSAVKDLGCTIKEFKDYLESRFLPGMSWENHGLHGWHIDHIKPLSSFDLTDRKQFLEACHYTNLQPLWAKDNIIKSDKLL